MRTFAPLDALYAEIARGTWIEPDAALDAMGGEGERYLEERLDEHLAALGPWIPPSSDPFELRLRVFRSAHDAADAWRAAWDPHGVSLAVQTGPAPRGPGRIFDLPRARVDVRWAEALRRCAQASDERIEPARAARPDAVVWHHELSAAVRPRLVEAASRSAAWRASGFVLQRFVGPYFAPVRGPGYAAFRCALALTLHAIERGEGGGASNASPWLPLLSIWNRGAWPFALPDGVLAVFVPRLGAPALEWPLVPHLAPYEGAADPVTNHLGFGLPARLPMLNTDVLVPGPLAPPEAGGDD